MARPALLTSTSIRAKRSATADTTSATDAGWVTSQPSTAAATPDCTSGSAAATARSTTTTVAPFPAYASTMARPMPDAPPVTTATLPASEKSRSATGSSPIGHLRSTGLNLMLAELVQRVPAFHGTDGAAARAHHDRSGAGTGGEVPDTAQQVTVGDTGGNEER